MAFKSSNDQSNRTYEIAHKLAEAAQRAPKGSATRSGLWNAFTKKHVAAEAMWHIEREQEEKEEDNTKGIYILDTHCQTTKETS